MQEDVSVAGAPSSWPTTPSQDASGFAKSRGIMKYYRALPVSVTLRRAGQRPAPRENAFVGLGLDERVTLSLYLHLPRSFHGEEIRLRRRVELAFFIVYCSCPLFYYCLLSLVFAFLTVCFP